MSRRFGVVAGSPQRAKTLFREMSLEQSYDVCWSVGVIEDLYRPAMLDTLFIDESAIPMDRATMDRLQCALKPGGAAYVLQQLRSDHVGGRW